MLFLNLRNFWQSIKKDKYLLAAIFLGLLLRGLNPTFGSPSLYVSNDEAIAHLAAWNMLAEKTPVSIANYTPLGAYLQIPFLVVSFLIMKMSGLVSNAGEFELFVLTHEGYFLFIPRLISALFGTLTILVIYKMTLALFKNSKTALIAAFLTAVSFNLVHISHFGKPWAASLFFFVLAVYLVLKDRTILSPISAALSYGFHQVGILVFPLIFFKLVSKKQFGVFLGSSISILIIAVLSLSSLRKGLLESIGNNQSFLLKGKFLADLLTGHIDLWDSFFRTLYENFSLYFLANLVTTDGIILIFGLIGIFLYLSRKRSHKEIIFYIVLYFLFASLFFHPLLRYLLPIILLHIPLAAFSINSLFGKWRLVIIMIIFLASVNSIWWNYLYFKKPTFIIASEWIEKNVGSDDKIANVGGRFTTFAPNKLSIEYMQKFDPILNQRLFVKGESIAMGNTINIFYLNKIPDAKENLIYYIVNYSPTYVVNYFFSSRNSLIYRFPNLFEAVVVFNPSIGGRDEEITETLFDPSSNFDTYDNRTHPSMYRLEEMGPIIEILKFKN